MTLIDYVPIIPPLLGHGDAAHVLVPGQQTNSHVLASVVKDFDYSTNRPFPSNDLHRGDSTSFTVRCSLSAKEVVRPVTPKDES